MAVSLLNITPATHHAYNTGNRITHFALPAKLQFQYSITKPSIRSSSFHILKSAPRSEFSVPNLPSDGENNVNDNLLDILNRLLDFIRSVIPGGSWWNLDFYDPDINSTVTAAKSITVLRALRQIWTLVADDRWVVYIAFGSLTIAALSEISMPSLLARCIFSAQSGETLVFTSNFKLLILLCLSSGVCSGLRGGCFGIANTVLDGDHEELLRQNGLYAKLYRIQTDALD